MANFLGNYNPIMFSQEALIWLRARLGMASRVHRALDDERSAAGREMGEVIRTKRPRTFTAQDHVPGVGSPNQDLKTQNVELRLDQHKEVKFGITDRELAYTTERIINDHIGPAANAVAESIDLSLYGLAPKVGPIHVISGAQLSSNDVAAMYTGPQRVLFNNRTPLEDGNLHYMIDGFQRERFQNADIFHRADTVGQNQNGTLFTGSLGTRFGAETFSSQIAGVSRAQFDGTLADSGAAGDIAGLIDGGGSEVEVNTETITIDGLTNGETVNIGDTFQVAGDPTVYAVQSAATVAGNAVTISIFPGLQFAAADNTAVSFIVRSATQEDAAGYTENLMFHRDCLGLVMAPLPTIGDGKGAEIAVASDPESGLSVRARMWYEGGTTNVNVALDALWGVQVMNGQLGVRVARPND